MKVVMDRTFRSVSVSAMVPSLLLVLLTCGTALGVDPGDAVSTQQLLADPPPRPSLGSGVEVGPPGVPEWIQVSDVVPTAPVPELQQSDPAVFRGDVPPDTRTPTPRIAWNAIINNPATIVPPDTHIAVGPGLGAAGRVVMVTNADVQIWDKTGTTIAGPTPLGTMFTPLPGNRIFDPKVLYDQHSGRFFIVALDGNTPASSRIHIAVSSSGTPNNLTTNWTFTAGSGVKTFGLVTTWADYPGIGADASALFVTTNQFNAANQFRGVNIRVFNKTQLMAGTYTFVDLTYDTTVTSGIFTVQPAHVYGATDNGGFYLINRIGWNSYRLYNVTGHPTLPLASTAVFAWAGGSFPSDTGADQCFVANPDLDTISSRIQNAVYRNGHLWCCLTSDPDNDGQTEVVWQDVVTNSFPPGTPAVFQSGFINGTTSPDVWTYVPSINVNAANDAAICYTESSPSICPNMSYVLRSSTDPPGTFQAPVVAKNSNPPGWYDSFTSRDPDRWGDYSGCVVDPTDDCFWLSHEFSNTSAVANSTWGTFVASFCPVPPTVACCFSRTACADMTVANCTAAGGTPRPAGSQCPTQGVQTSQHGSVTVVHWTNPAIDCFQLRRGDRVGVWAEDFDDYETGSGMAGQGGWDGWEGDPTFDAVVTDVQSRSWPNSVDVAGPTDLVHEYNGATTGQWVYTAWSYVPSDFQSGGTEPYRGSFFILLNTYDPPDFSWSVQLHADGDTNTFIRDGVTPTSLPLITDQWVEVKVAIDLDNDLYRVFYNGTELGAAESWTGAVLGEGDGVLNIGAVDLYASGSSSVYWDDLTLLPAEADCLPGPSIDAWMTDPAETGQEMCHLFGPDQPCSPPIPPGFFGPGSDPFEGQICLAGEPLGNTEFGSFSIADTLILRTGDPFDRCELQAPDQAVSAEIVELSLRSVSPIEVTYFGGMEVQPWEVSVDLSDIHPTFGEVLVTRTHCNGGTYSSIFDVWPRFTFTKLQDPSQVQVLDTGDPIWGLCPITLEQVQDTWVVDADPNFFLDSPWCTDFHPGIEDMDPTLECDCNGNGIRDDCDILSAESEDCQLNGIPDECEPDFDSDQIIDDCDNCDLEPNPDQADADGDGDGDACDLCPEVARRIEGDHDGDRKVDGDDNCPCIANKCQQDTDGDGIGDACDTEGDYELDGDVDLADFQQGWDDCMTGPDSGPHPPDCAPFDFDLDTDVDLWDFRAFQYIVVPCYGEPGGH